MNSQYSKVQGPSPLFAFVKKWWWVVTVLLVSFSIFTLASKKKYSEIKTLKSRVATLENQKVSASHEREDLLRQIDSQSDPAWIELILMKGLGLVPDGHKKVYFHKED